MDCESSRASLAAASLGGRLGDRRLVRTRTYRPEFTVALARCASGPGFGIVFRRGGTACPGSALPAVGVVHIVLWQLSLKAAAGTPSIARPPVTVMRQQRDSLRDGRRDEGITDSGADNPGKIGSGHPRQHWQQRKHNTGVIVAKPVVVTVATRGAGRVHGPRGPQRWSW